MSNQPPQPINRTCQNCKHADTYFGDCTHPKGGPTKVVKAVEQCIRKAHAWWEPDDDMKKVMMNL